MPDYRHPAPPYMRSRKPGRAVARHQVGKPAEGAHRPNMCVAPLVHTDGKGNRVLFDLDRPNRMNPDLTDIE